jgi:hypothetical protein
MIHKSLFSNVKLTIFSTAMGIASQSSGAPGEIAVLAMIQVSDPAGYEQALAPLGSSLAERGCSVRRDGSLSGTRGPLELPESNRFLLLECKSSLLAGPGSAAFESLAPHAEVRVLLEGGSTWSDGDSAVTQRVYTIKLSEFNHDRPGQRDRELASIGSEAALRPHAWVNESVIAVDRAFGISKPDDVTVLYYRSPEDAKAFREQNKDILKRVGAFNKAHLASYVYASGSAVR